MHNDLIADLDLEQLFCGNWSKFGKCLLHWLLVHFHIIFKVILLVYKVLNGSAPSYISDLLSYMTCSRSLRSSAQKLLNVYLNLEQRPIVMGILKWLLQDCGTVSPTTLELISNIKNFKNQMKTYLFRLACNDYYIFL